MVANTRSPRTRLTVSTTKRPATQLQKEALIQFNAINDPYLCGEDIVFSTSTIVDGVSVFNQLHIYNTQTQSSEQVQGITLKYENLLFPKINEKYIVWLDSHPDGGGRICALDRATGKQFLIKEYAFALPQYSLSGNRIAFMQQAGNSLDKLYLYDLQTRESVALKVYTNLPAIPGTAHLSGNMLTWSVPKEANGTVVSTLYTYDLQTGQETPYDTGKLVTAPKSDGKNIAFLSSISGPADSLYVMDGQTAELIAQDVENYDVGDGFLVYTKEENLFLYGFASHEHRKINTELSRGLLVSVNGKQICWYDVTAGFGDIDVVRYADVSTLEV